MITQQWSSDSSHSVTEKETSYELEKKGIGHWMGKNKARITKCGMGNIS